MARPLGFALALAAFACSTQQDGGRPATTGALPNVILILADDLKPTILGFEGDPVVRTPNLDRLAREGTSFSRAYVPLPQCGPSRAALLSGRYPHDTGALTNPARWRPDQKSIAQLLGDRGYRTGFVGKWHLQNDGEAQAGFEDWCAIDRAWRDYMDPVLWIDGKPQKEQGYMPELLTDKAIEFIDRNGERAEAPFFLWLAYMTPHMPWTQPPDPRLAYAPDEVPLPASIADDLSEKPAAQRESDCHASFTGRTIEHVRSQLAIYYAMVSALDASVGRLLDHVRDRGLERDTLVVFLSDNGFVTSEHQMITKCPAMYEELVRTPLVLRWPERVPAGARLDALVSTLDLLPTLVRAAGGTPPEGLPGVDLMPLVTGAVERVHDELFLEYSSKQHERVPILGMVTPEAKYVRYLATDEEELYDLRTDPHEMRNLARSSEHADELARLRARVDVFRDAIDVPFW